MAKHKKHHHEEHIDETWLIPYADLLTLLLALFIVLFATSKVDAHKFEQLVKSLNVAFNGGNGVLQNPAPFTTKEEQTIQKPENDPAKKLEENKNENQKILEAQKKYALETEQLEKLKQQLDKYIEQNKLKDKLQTKVTEEGLLITILDNALFDSGSASVKQGARKLAAEISKLLIPDSRRVTVSGHTDNVPIYTSEFPSNWDLSSKRAVNFMKILLENQALDPVKFSSSGLGEYHPIASNSTPDGRAKNRRVEVSILRNFTQPPK